MFIGLTEPSGRCINVNFRKIALMQTLVEHPHNTIVMLDSGVCREVTETPAEIERIWLESGSQTDPKPAEAAATPERPKTITVDELRVGDEIDFGLEERMRYNDNTCKGNYEFCCTKWLQCFPPKVMERLLARGVRVYRDGKLISGWPVESPPPYVISEPVMTYEEVLSSASRNIKRVAELEAELAAIKSQPQEVSPLDPWRVLATAVRVLRKHSSKITPGNANLVREKRSFLLAADAIEAANGAPISSEPYETM